MSDGEYVLPQAIERYLETLSKLYEARGIELMHEIIVNSEPLVHPEWNSWTYDRGYTGHALHLRLPEPLFLRVMEDKEEVEERIAGDINKIHNVRDEHFDAVFVELKPSPGSDWRNKSGRLIGEATERDIPPSAVRRLWKADYYKVFLSHKSKAKKDVAALKSQLDLFGISAFVAHEDIHPSTLWQEEIENALRSMNAFVALMTPDFHESDWTDQEVGFAFARGVPIIAANLGRMPYGFIGKFQALSCDWSTAALEIAKLFVKQEMMIDPYINAVLKYTDYARANILAQLLPNIERLTPGQANKLVAAFNDNAALKTSFAFNGTDTRRFGNGLVFHLNRLDTTREFRMTTARTINAVPRSKS